MPAKVSCILPTTDRPEFFRQALRYFENQTWPEKEIIVVDDSVSHYTGTLPENSRYIYLDSPRNLGEKINIGIEKASGSIIQKWDDDDYYHPDFLTTTVTALENRGSLNGVSYYESFLTLLSETGKLVFSGHGWRAGATMCFYRKYWEDHRFLNVARAVDWHFFEKYKPDHIPIDDPEKFIHIRHQRGHTWTQLGGKDVSRFFQDKPAYAKPLSALMAARDLDFYNSLKQEPSTTTAETMMAEVNV